MQFRLLITIFGCIYLSIKFKIQIWFSLRAPESPAWKSYVPPRLQLHLYRFCTARWWRRTLGAFSVFNFCIKCQRCRVKILMALLSSFLSSLPAFHLAVKFKSYIKIHFFGKPLCSSSVNHFILSPSHPFSILVFPRPPYFPLLTRFYASYRIVVEQ